MSGRPNLDNSLDSKTFKEYYYLKEELVNFCRKNNLQTTGGKIELTERIANFLETGERTYKSHNIRKNVIIDDPYKILLSLEQNESLYVHLKSIEVKKYD